MSDMERMEERIYVFADADKRAQMTPEEQAKCPTLEDIYETIAKAVLAA